MAFITLSGTLLDPNGDLAVGDQIRFTHKSTTGETVQSAVSIITVNPAGTYSLPLQYGLVLVEYKDVRTQQFKNLGVATVNSDNPATSIPELLNALVPVSSAELIEFQAILADCVTAQTAAESAATTAEAFAYQLTTTDLIASTATFAAATSIPTSGFTTSGDGGNGSWKQTGLTGQTPSQSPAQLGDALLNDGNGNQWELVITTKSTPTQLGAKRNGIADDTAPTNAFISTLFSKGYRGYVNLDSGTYRTTSPIVLTGTGMALRGNGAEFSTTILADFAGTNIDDSPAIIIKGRYSGVENLTIEASPARKAAPYNALSAGIAINPPDNAANNCWFGTYKNLIISGHHGDAILSIGGTWLSEFSKLTLFDNKGQGMRFDNGELTSRADKKNPGEIDITNVMIYDNGGHGIQIGNDNNVSNRGFRFNINNADLYRNAEAAGTRKSADQLWAFFDSSRIETSGFDGNNQAETVVTGRGMSIAGRAITVNNNRFLNITPQAIKVNDFVGALGYSTYGINIGQMSVFNDTPLDELVSYDSTVTNITVSPQTNASVLGIVPLTFSIPITKRVEMTRKASTQTINNSTTLIDVTDFSTLSCG